MGGNREANRSMTEPRKKKKGFIFESRVEQRLMGVPQDG